jgi:acylphosphatase
MSTRTVRIRISGIVQGVGFRHWTWMQAQHLHICGWVRNLPDGRVEVLAQAEAEPLEQFLDLLRQGPPFARVDDLEQVALSHHEESPRRRPSRDGIFEEETPQGSRFEVR